MTLCGGYIRASGHRCEHTQVCVGVEYICHIDIIAMSYCDAIENNYDLDISPDKEVHTCMCALHLISV